MSRTQGISLTHLFLYFFKSDTTRYLFDIINLILSAVHENSISDLCWCVCVCVVRECVLWLS